MNRIRIKLNKICSMASFVAIVLGIAVFALPGIVVAQDYEGSEFCQECHEVNYSLWKVSGHPYKLMKSEEARNRPIPLPIGYTWDDISYVIGGYKWKSRYIDLDGYIITTTFDEDGNPKYRVSTNTITWWVIGPTIMPARKTNPTIADPAIPPTGWRTRIPQT